ncbi:hypothetical protein [Shouchella miscanthi]|nr:hypothetical protein [Shouchella miscanthi]
MLITFQIILAIMIVIFGLGTIGEKHEEDKRTYSLVTCVAIAAMAVTIIF